MSNFRKRIALILELLLSCLFVLTALYASLYANSRPCIEPYCDNSVSPPEHIFGDSYDVRMYYSLIIENLEPWIGIGTVAGIFGLFLFISNMLSKRRTYIVLRTSLLVLGLVFMGWLKYLTVF
jgi:hypothetical protein